MRKHYGTLLGGFAAVGLVSGALAADLPRHQPYQPSYKTPQMMPHFTWTGFYIGGNVGYGWSNGSGTITFGPNSGPYSGSGDGVLGGLQAGYNWQTGSVVLGLETDIQASGGRGSVTGQAGGTTFSGTGKTPWFGTIRARIGYAFDRTMVYATGGAVYGQSKLDGVSSTLGPFSSSVNYWSWTLGGGLEHAIWERWSTKLEYLYVGSPNRAPIPPNTAIDGTVRSHIVRAGLNYRF